MHVLYCETNFYLLFVLRMLQYFIFLLFTAVDQSIRISVERNRYFNFIALNIVVVNNDLARFLLYISDTPMGGNCEKCKS